MAVARTPEEPVLELELDPLAVWIARHLDGDPDVATPDLDDWISWVELGDVTRDTVRATRWRLSRVPLPHLEALVDRAVGGRTDNPWLLQLLDEPFLRLRGSSLPELARRLRSHLGVESVPNHQSRRRCRASSIEHEDDADGSGAATQSPAPSTALDAVVVHLETEAPMVIRRLMAFMAEQGGSLRLDEERFAGTSLVAELRRPDLFVSQRWLTLALRHPADVYANIAHELGGHLFYGATLGCSLAMEAFGSLAEAGASDFAEFASRYHLPETEIYAELKELGLRSDGALGDDPGDDVPARLRQLRQNHPPDVADLVIEWMRFRFERDATLTHDALRLFEVSVAATAPSHREGA